MAANPAIQWTGCEQGCALAQFERWAWDMWELWGECGRGESWRDETANVEHVSWSVDWLAFKVAADLGHPAFHVEQPLALMKPMRLIARWQNLFAGTRPLAADAWEALSEQEAADAEWDED